jgi:hypothetical protein
MSKKVPIVDLTVDNINNTVWKERVSKKGNTIFFRKHNTRWINVGKYKSGHVFVSVDNRLVENHDIHYTTNEQLKEDVDNMLDTLVIIS